MGNNYKTKMVTKLRLFLIGNKRGLTSTSVELEELSAQTHNVT